ncbi:MAG TPA: hypothetical protein VJN01_08070, partial [Xanthomonadales bacterium]|nr:hypothetical protein [Xanthomonadales bacterium]
YDNYLYTQVDLSSNTDPPNFLTPVNGCVNTQVLFVGDDVVPWNPALVGQPGVRRGFTVDCSGKDSLNSPEWTATFGIQQTFNFDDFTLIGNLSGRYRDDRELSFGFEPGSRADSDLTADFALTMISGNGNMTLTAYVHNLTDETIAATYQLGAGNVSGSALEPPRTYGLRLGYQF